jgi:hypothetical protein
VDSDEEALDVLTLPDEAYFHLSCYVNKENSRCWSDGILFRARRNLSITKK